MTEMGRLEFTTPREAWGGEAEAFTPLLAQPEMLEYLGQATGIGPLSLVEVEHTTAGSRSLDILAEMAGGGRVSIENQYGRADHDHLTRGLAYAVATESKALVVIAEDHRDEFVSVADYLNDMAGMSERGIGVWLVQVRATRRVGDSIWSPEFVVQAEPNEWEATVRRETPRGFESLDAFYEECASQAGPEWAAAARVIVDDWEARPKTRVDHSSSAQVSLYCETPRSARGLNVMSITPGGGFTICRGYIWDYSGVFDPEVPPTDLDDRIKSLFPDAHWPEKQYYITERQADPHIVHEFADWLTDTLAASRAPDEAST